MNTQLIFSISDFENLNWEQHPIFKDTVGAKVFFSNGYGVSIVTQTEGDGATGLLSSFFKAYGSYKKATYEAAVVRGTKDKNDFIFCEDVLDLDPEDCEDYEVYGGIWVDLPLNKVLQKINLVALL